MGEARQGNMLAIKTRDALNPRKVNRDISSRNSSVPRSASQKNEDKTLKMVVIVMIAFLFCWSPYAILAVFTTANRSVKIDAVVATIPAYFAKTATIYNPVIYFALNNKFRKSVIRILVQKADVTFPSSHTT